MSNAPNYYSTQATLGNATTSGITLAFGFDARGLRLANYEAVDMYVNLVGNLPTTADLYLRACSSRWLADLPPIPGLGAITTSTCSSRWLADLPPIPGLGAITTSTSAVAKVLRVTALGG